MVFKGNQLHRRISIIIFIFSLLWLILFLRSIHLQLIPNEKLSELKNKLFDRTVTLKPRRGTIYDRHNKELAISIPSQSLFADPKNMKEPYYAAKKLSRFLNLSHKKTLKKLLNKKRRFAWIKRHLNEKEIKEIKSWNFEGLYFIKESKRFYTKGNSLSQVLGFTGIEGQGLEGIERQYNEVLKGEAQKVLLKRDARGRPLFMDFSLFITKVSGFDIYLTIDSDLQFYLEKELKQALINSEAESAIGIILSAKTSEILAMANIPDYNPNALGKGTASHRRNRALTDIFEPGSTFKAFTLISALKKGIDPTQTYPSNEGELKIGKAVIREADPKKKFKAFLNMSEILSLSSNVGSAEIALDIGPENLRRTLSLFGFGEKTGVDFPGEAKGLLRKLPWKPLETATISFGHGIAGTALQVANAYASIANGGLLKKPFFVREIKNPYTGEGKKINSQTLRRVLTPEEARILTLMLTSATEKEGTGAKAAVPGYFVAGKTGTAQKVDLKNKGYKKGEYITSFAGFIPAHDPKFVIYLLIDGAKANFYSSSLVAPLFSQVASYSVRSAGLSPTLVGKDNMISTAQNKPQTDGRSIANQNTKRQIVFVDHRVPDLKGLTLREALNRIHGTGLKLHIQGSGWIIRSTPPAGKPLPEDKQITLILDEIKTSKR